MYHNGKREISERFDILRSGTVIGELYGLPGVTIRASEAAEIKTACSGTFRRNPGFNRLRDYVRPMYCENGLWRSLGVFVTSSASASYVDDSGDMKLELCDLGLLVQRRMLEYRLFFFKNESYTDIVRRLLADCGITDILCEDANARLLSDREDWEIGESYLTVINQLLSEINYDPLWFDANGYARVQRSYDAAVDHTYEAGVNSVTEPQYEVTDNLHEIYNVFIAVVSSPDFDKPLVAKVEDTDPNSPTSTVNAIRNAKIFRPDNIASQDELERYVRAERDRAVRQTETVSFKTAVASHGIGDSIRLIHHQARGVYHETEWSITLGPNGSMSHKVVRFLE